MPEQKTSTIGLLGQGLIYQHVKNHVERLGRIISLTTKSTPQALSACDIVVFCSDIWSPRTLQETNRLCRQAQVALLPIFTQFDEAIVGPCAVPHQPGCTSCAELRRLGATAGEPDRELLRQSFEQEDEPEVTQSWLSSFSLETLAVLATQEIRAYLQNLEQLQTACAMLTLSLATLECRRHTFLPFAACPVCGQLPDDQAKQASIELQARPKASAAAYRMSQPAASAPEILSTYADERAGLVSGLMEEYNHLLPIVSSRLSAENDGTTGTGTTLRSDQSRLLSVLEVIERYAGLRPRGKRTRVHASYRQLVKAGETVLDPTTLGLHTPEQYKQSQQQRAHRQMTPYHPDLACHWVWGYSFQKRAPILVPEHSAYYGVPTSEDNPLFASDVSNGCALGGCLEEAIFHGMLEVVERDAFLLMWYAQLQVPRLNLNSLTNPEARMLLAHIEHHSGYTIQAFNITHDHAVPCLCLLCVDEENRPGKQKAFVAAGSHPQPEQALMSALREFAMYLVAPRPLDEEGKAEALAMLKDANLVQRMDHHPLVYYLPEAFERMNFLYRTPRQQTFQEAFSEAYQNPPTRMDLRDDLEWLIDFYGKGGTDVIVVEQTTSEHRACGLHCVKVLMPGLLPMTFGTHNRRTTGLERLNQLPFTLGYRDQPLTEAEINPHPHPFF